MSAQWSPARPGAVFCAVIFASVLIGATGQITVEAFGDPARMDHLTAAPQQSGIAEYGLVAPTLNHLVYSDPTEALQVHHMGPLGAQDRIDFSYLGNASNKTSGHGSLLVPVDPQLAKEQVLAFVREPDFPYPEWSSAKFLGPTTYFDLKNVPSAYVFEVALQDDYAGFIAVNARSNTVMHYTRAHPPHQFAKSVQEAVQGMLGQTKTAPTYLCLGPMQYFVRFGGMVPDEPIVFPLRPTGDGGSKPILVRDLEELQQDFEAYTYSKIQQTDHANSNEPNAEMLLTPVEAYEWTRGCAPTTAAMLLNYWGTHGWPTLRHLPGYYNWDGPMNEWNPRWGAKELIDHFADYFGFSQSGGTGDDYGTQVITLGGAYESVASDHGVKAFTTYWMFPAYNNFVQEIEEGRPVHMHFDSGDYSAHSTFGFGYRDTPTTDEMALYNTYDLDGANPTTQWVDFSGSSLQFWFVALGGIDDIVGRDLVLGQWGTVKVIVVAPWSGEYKVRAWDDDGWSAPEWSWQWIESGVITLAAGEHYTFTFSTQPDTLSEGFEFWLYQKDALGLFEIVDKVETTLTAAPPVNAPSDLNAAAASKTQINLSWQDNSSDETAFHIERSPDGTTGWTEIDTVGANTTNYNNTALTCNTTYYYRVRAYRGGDEQYSEYTNIDYAGTQACSSPALSSPAISPGNSGTPSTAFVFSITYTDPDNQPPNTIQVVVDGTPYGLTSGDPTYNDGAIFSSTPRTFGLGTHSYYFQATQGSWNGRVPASGSYIFEVNSGANGLNLTSDTYSIPMDGSSHAHLTAHVSDNQGNPVVGALVTFMPDTGGVSPYQDTTDASGNAHTTFTPSEIGDAHVSASTSSGLSDQVTINVYQSSGLVETTLQIRLVSQGETQSAYNIDGDSRYASNGNPVGHTDIVYTVLGESGQPFGSLESTYYGTHGNPVTDRTDQWGDSSVYLTVNSSQQVTIRAEILGSVDTMASYVQVGPVNPADLQPFTVVSFPGEITDLEMSPSGNGLAATSDGGRTAQILDPTTYQFVYSLANPHTSYEESFSTAFSRNGARLAVGTDDHSDYYATLIYNGTDYGFQRGVQYGTAGGQVLAVDLAPDGARVATGESGGTCSSYRAPILHIWDSSSGGELYALNDWIGFESIQAVDWSAPVAGYSSGLIAVGDDEGRIRILSGSGYGQVAAFWGYHLANYTGPCYTHYHAQQIHDLQWSPDGMRLAVGSDAAGEPSNILIFDRNGTTLNTLVGHIDDVYSVDWAHNSDRLLSASLDGTLRIWNPTTGQLIMQFGTGNPYSDAQWSADDTEIFASRRNGDIEVYSLVDSAGPTIIISHPPEGYSTPADNADVIGQVTDPHFVSAAYLNVNGGAPIPLALDASGHFTQNVALAEGANTITAQATDGCGNDSSVSVHITRLVDTDPPLISNVTRSPTQGDFSTIFQVTAQIQDLWTGVNPSTVQLFVQRPDEVSIATLTMHDDGINGGDVAAGDSVYSAQWNASGAPSEGIYLLDLQAADMRGNTRHAENASSLQVRDYPIISNVNHTPISPTDSIPVTVTANLTDFSGVTSAVLNYSTNDGGTWLPRTMSLVSGSTWRTTIPALSQGTILFKITAADPLANSTNSPEYSYWVQDVTAPVFYGWQRQPYNVTEDTSGAVVIQVSVYDTGGSGLQGMIPEFDWHVTGGYNGWEPMTPVSGDTWSFTIPTQDWNALQGQDLLYKVRGADVAGNMGIGPEQSEFINPVNDAPVITAYSPISATLEVPPGACQTFAITAMDVDSPILTTTWELDGNGVGSGTSYDYCPTDQLPHSLWATVTDGELFELQSWLIADDDMAGPLILTPTYALSVPSDLALVVTAVISDALTGNKGVISATLSYGYQSPYDQHVVVGNGPGGNGDGEWTFTIPAQGPGHEGDTMFFSLTATDGDNTSGSTTADNGGSGYPVTVTQAQYTLTVNTVGNGTVVKTPNQPTYTYGTVVTVTAAPDPGWTFTDWSGACIGVGACHVTMDENKAITATFDQAQYTLTVNTVGNGTVVKTPNQPTYTYGTVVTVTAAPDPGWTFTGWSGACTGAGACHVTMDENKTLTATFDQAQYTLTVNTVGNGTVVKTPNLATYTYGTVVTVTAVPDLGWTFTGWSGACTGAGTCHVTMDGNKTVAAAFAKLVFLPIVTR